MICIICDNMACFCPERDEDFFSGPDYGSKNKYVKRGIHVMNKNESKMCRKLMAETGLTEEELRKDKKYRILLSEAQKLGSTELDYYGKVKRTRKRKMKEATLQTGLAKEHPKTIEVFKELMSELRW